MKMHNHFEATQGGHHTQITVAFALSRVECSLVLFCTVFDFVSTFTFVRNQLSLQYTRPQDIRVESPAYGVQCQA